MTNSDKDGRQRGYVRKHYEARKAEGKVKCSFWLEPAAAEALAFLIDRTPGMSKEQVINRALRYLAIRAKLDEKELEEALKGTGEFPAP